MKQQWKYRKLQNGTMPGVGRIGREYTLARKCPERYSGRAGNAFFAFVNCIETRFFGN